jgi:hypothetical protein
MKYFQFQRVIPYTFDSSSDVSIVDITQHAKVAERLGQYTSALYDYVIADDERPDTVARKVYGSVDYTWLILLINNIFTLYDWPLSNQELEEYLISKYGSIANAQTGARTYYTVEGDRVDALTYDELPEARQGITLTPYEQEVKDNEAKRRIRVVRSAFVPMIARMLRTLYR